MSERQTREGLVAGVPKDYRPWIKVALAAGFRIEQRGTHTKLRRAGSPPIVVPTNSNNGLRTVFRNQLRDHGVPV